MQTSAYGACSGERRENIRPLGIAVQYRDVLAGNVEICVGVGFKVSANELVAIGVLSGKNTYVPACLRSAAKENVAESRLKMDADSGSFDDRILEQAVA